MLKAKIKGMTGQLSTWTAVLLVCLLLIYYIITLVNTNQIAEQVEMISNRPFPIVIEVGKVTTYTARLNGLAERLAYIRTDDVLEGVWHDYEEIDEKFTGSLDFIVANYRYKPEDATIIQGIYLELRDRLYQYIVLCEDPSLTDEEAAFYYSEYIKPKIGELDGMAGTINLGARARFAELEQLVGHSRFNTILFSTILSLAVLGALFIYLRLLRKNSLQEEELRNGLKDALTSAQNANAAKSQFLSNMSHDIRTPMNAIIGMTAIAGMNLEDSEKVKDCLRKVSASSTHLLGLINDVLDMSKIESGKVTLNNEEIMLPELIQEFITLIQQQTKTKHLELNVSISNLEHERVIGDKLRLNQILLNIMGNAVKFTPAGGEVSLKIQELPSQYHGYGTYQFTVSDNGIGMSEEFLEKVFQPFERAQSSTNSKIEGTGLGMAIVKSIVDMMNGQITTRSQIGSGTTFQVTLHFKLQKADMESFDLSALRELRTLVVDDDQDVCEDTTRMLEEIGMNSEWVLTGAEAVSKTVDAHQVNRDYHSVIIDWKMPEMDGLETTRRIRRIVGDDVPIIILTAYDWTDIEEEANEAGVNAFLAKPLFKSRLYHVMYDVISGVPLSQKPMRDDFAGILLEGRVLLVEDNELNMEIAQELIQNCGGAVERAWDGEEAVRMVENAPDGYYDIVFMDVRMPHMDGYEATRHIRQLELAQRRIRTPIVAMSADAFVEDQIRADEAGMDGYITKPVALTELNRVLKEYLRELA